MVRTLMLLTVSALVVLRATSAAAPALSDERQALPRTVDFGPDDPVPRDPLHYKVEFENEHVRAVRVRYGPKEKGISHEHRCGRVTVFLTPLHQTLQRPDGTRTESRANAGDARWSTPDRHADENLAGDIELVYVDVKSSCPSR